MWRGLPTNAKQEGQKLQSERDQCKDRIDKKRLHLQELLSALLGHPRIRSLVGRQFRRKLWSVEWQHVHLSHKVVLLPTEEAEAQRRRQEQEEKTIRVY